MNAFARILKLLLGALFVFSALAKFVSIDEVYVYIYSFGFLSLNLSVVAGWFLIGTELLLGMMLIGGWHHRWVCLANLLMLLGFCGFLSYSFFIGRTDNCHCFGELLPFDPLRSLLKNAVLIVLSLIVWRFGQPSQAFEEKLSSGKLLLYKPWCFILSIVAVVVPAGLIALSGFMGWMHMTFIDLEYTCVLVAVILAAVVLLEMRWIKSVWVRAAVALAPYVALLVLSTYVKLFGSEDSAPYSETKLEQLMADGAALDPIDEGRRVVAFYSRTCSYCRKASHTLTLIQQRNNLDEEYFINVFPGNDSTDLSVFFQDNNATQYQHWMISPQDFVELTQYSFPLILLLDNGKVVHCYGHGDISETQIRSFLEPNHNL